MVTFYKLSKPGTMPLFEESEESDKLDETLADENEKDDDDSKVIDFNDLNADDELNFDNN